jgi:hypothetical protein
MDLKFNAKQNEFKNFISLIPGVYSESFKDVQTSGLLAFNGFVKGVYNDTKMPGFGLTLKINNGKFKYPSLPVGVNDVQVDLSIINPDGVPDHTLINLQRLHAILGGDSFDAKMIVKTVSILKLAPAISNKDFFSKTRGFSVGRELVMMRINSLSTIEIPIADISVANLFVPRSRRRR